MQNQDISIFSNLYDLNNNLILWNQLKVSNFLEIKLDTLGKKKIGRYINKKLILNQTLSINDIKNSKNQNILLNIAKNLIQQVNKKRGKHLYVYFHKNENNTDTLIFQDARGSRYWLFKENNWSDITFLKIGLDLISSSSKNQLLIIPNQKITDLFYDFKIKEQIQISNNLSSCIIAHVNNNKKIFTKKIYKPSNSYLTHIDKLEAESVHILREVISETNNPVMLYSIGKDSAVMLHLALKAFYPSKPPFSLLHVDTGWKFREMYSFRDYIVKKHGMNLIVHKNPEGVKKNINPFDHGSSIHTDIMKTEGLKQALNKGKFDAAFGGARRDEEKSRAKERIFSFRNSDHQWDSKNQRPELWDLYNAEINVGESIRVFPISNWTENDIWLYICRENIEIVPLYFAKERPFIIRNNSLIMIDDERIKLSNNEKVIIDKIRFRTLGCYPLTGAIISQAENIEEIILELLNTKNSERQDRIIDKDGSSSMERKKIEGYF